MSTGPGSKRWSDPRLQSELRKYWDAGKSATEIGCILSVSRNSVLGAAHRLGLPKRASGGRPRGDGKPLRSRPVVKLQEPTDELGPVAVGKLSPEARARRVKLIKTFAAPLVHSMPLEAFKDGYRGQKGRVPLERLQSHHCRFPIDCADGVLRYCGEPKHGKTSYCLHHAERCGVRP